MLSPQNLFTDFDFQQLDSPDFKEDSVREVLILPILLALGYKTNQIARSKTLQHPFVKIGSKKRPVNLVPDYLLKVDDSYAWVLDAKAPTEDVQSGDHLEQIYSYAIHPEVRARYFALCNGRSFVLFRKKGTATDLSFLKKESVDYIYTDPPYGKKIPYLDLSIMWNAWLDLAVTESDYAQEAIEGGEHGKTKDDYNSLIAKSIEEMYRALKFDRWMSFVFAHKDPEFWHLIIDTAERCGFEYAGAVPQKNGQTSFKKRQNPFTVLSGQLIINFRKVRQPKAILKAALGMNIGEAIIQTVEGIIARHDGATLEQINDELIIKGLELGFLDLMKKEYTDLTPFLVENFDYNDATELFSIRKNAKFKTQIDVRLRIRYYLISYLRRQALEKKTITFDEIVLYIMPLLKNGHTPENQTILKVLEDIGDQVSAGCWRLKEKGQLRLLAG